MRSVTHVVWVLLAATIVGTSAAFSAEEDRVTVVHAGQLLAIPGEEVVGERTIVVVNDRISQVVTGFVDATEFSKDAVYIDWSDRFVLPGLMDMHVHLLSEIDVDSHADLLTVTPAIEALRGAKNARSTLYAGFTTVRDLGGTPEAIFAVRDAIANGDIEGPRIFATGSYLSATGGHGDVHGLSIDLMKQWRAATICDGPYDCRRATRQAIKDGSDWIKVTATGGVLSDTTTGTDQQLTDDELQEIVATAHALGRKVAAHAHGVDGIIASLRAGVDSIDHGSFTNKEAIRLFKEKGTYLVPTLLPGRAVPEMMEGNPFFTDAIKEKVLQVSASASENAGRAWREGVSIAFGTDTGVTPHGQNGREFALMVKAGIPEMDAIRSATVISAKLLGIADELGSIEVGKVADLIAVEGDPLKDVSTLENVRGVIKDGRLVH